MQDESYWVDRAQSAEAINATLQESVAKIKEDSKSILETFSARKKSDGSFDIDFAKFIENIGEDSAMELKQIIDEMYSGKLKAVR